MNKTDRKIVNGLKRAARAAHISGLVNEIESRDDKIAEAQDMTGRKIEDIPTHIEQLERALSSIGLEHWIGGNYSLGEMHLVKEAILRAFTLGR